MKLIHLADLHLGKRVYEFSMLEDQRQILRQISGIIEEEAPDGVILAGDVYDKGVPPTQAVDLFDQFLCSLAAKHLQVFIIAGNHDSPERLAFANRLIDATGIHLSPVYNGSVTPYRLQDEFGEVHLYMLPFLKPAMVRRFFPEEEIGSVTDAIRTAIAHMDVDPGVRNVLVAHQFVTGATRSESEEVSVGGADNVDAEVFDPFDYVALGHIHTPQNIGSRRIRYAGTPLKYSFSEAGHPKSVTVVELGEKGELTVTARPLTPVHDMVERRGTYSDLTLKSSYEGTSYPEDYVHITLTDEQDVPDAMNKLRTIYHNLMKLDYDNARTRSNAVLRQEEDVEHRSPLDLFAQFYEQCNNAPMTEEQRQYMRKITEEIWGEET